MSHQQPKLVLGSLSAVRYDNNGPARSVTFVSDDHPVSSVAGSICSQTSLEASHETSREASRETGCVGTASRIKYGAHGSLHRVKGIPGRSLTPHTSNYSLARSATASEDPEGTGQERADKRSTCSNFSWANLFFYEERPGKLPGEEFSSLKKQYEHEHTRERTKMVQEKANASVHQIEPLCGKNEYETQCRQQLNIEVRELTRSRIIMAEAESWFEDNYNQTQGCQNMQEDFGGRMPAINKGWLDRTPDGKHTTPANIPDHTREQFDQRWHEDDLKHEPAHYYAYMGWFARPYQSQYVQTAFQSHANVVEIIAYQNEYQRRHGPGKGKHLPPYKEDENGCPISSFNFPLPPQTSRVCGNSAQLPPLMSKDLNLQDGFSVSSNSSGPFSPDSSDSGISEDEYFQEPVSQSRFSVDSSIEEVNVRSVARRTRGFSRELKNRASKIWRE